MEKYRKWKYISFVRSVERLREIEEEKLRKQKCENIFALSALWKGWEVVNAEDSSHRRARRNALEEAKPYDDDDDDDQDHDHDHDDGKIRPSPIIPSP